MNKRVFIADAIQAQALRDIFNLGDDVEFIDVKLSDKVMQCNLTELLAAMDIQLTKNEIDSIKKEVISRFRITGTDNTFCDECGLFDFFIKSNIGGCDFLRFLAENQKAEKVADIVLKQAGTCHLAEDKK